MLRFGLMEEVLHIGQSYGSIPEEVELSSETDKSLDEGTRVCHSKNGDHISDLRKGFSHFVKR